MEEWRLVEGYIGLYEVSDLGQVRSLDRTVIRNGRPMHRKGCLLRTSVNSAGYQTAKLSREGKQSSHSVHVLVAGAFLGARPTGLNVLHGAGGQLDNRALNLRYGTQSQNALDTIRDGTNWWKNIETCCRGHRLEPPNLMPSSPYRACLACNRGHGTVRSARSRGVTVDLKIEADRHYAAIMVTPERS